jgi:hypothetical protein
MLLNCSFPNFRALNEKLCFGGIIRRSSRIENKVSEKHRVVFDIASSKVDEPVNIVKSGNEQGISLLVL